jgi:hypothetical protein
MSDSLLDGIRISAENYGDVTELDQDFSNKFIDDIAKRFSFNTDKLWWWEDNSNYEKIVEYGQGSGLEELAKELFGQRVYLVVTNDEFPPWTIFKGPLPQILKIVYDQHFFEYLLVSDDENRCVFDTHQNSLVFFKTGN